MDIQCNNCQSYLNIREVVTRCTKCKELILKPKTKNMKNNFKGKDRVYFEPYGWGTIVVINNTIAIINFDILSDSINIISDFYPLLSFTEYKLEGFTQERPFEPKIGEKYFFWNDETIINDAVGYGRLKQISNNINFPYFFGTKYFQFCSETNPLL
jgi:hypothetical protein